MNDSVPKVRTKNETYTSCGDPNILSNSYHNQAFVRFHTDTNCSPQHDQHDEISLELLGQDNDLMAATAPEKDIQKWNDSNETYNDSNKSLSETYENMNNILDPQNHNNDLGDDKNEEKKTLLYHNALISQDLIQNEDGHFEHEDDRRKSKEEQCESRQGSQEDGEIHLLSKNEGNIDQQASQSSQQNQETEFDRKDQNHHINNQQKEQDVQQYSKVHEIVHTRFDDIIGHEHAKLRLDEALLPLALPPSLASKILTGIRASPASILLYGPPGCGKTQLARAVAGEAQAAFMNIGPSDILSKFVGESEASVRKIFKEAWSSALSMESRCTVLFFDEIDALGLSRGGVGDGNGLDSIGDNGGRRILAELLIQMTKFSHDFVEDYDNKNLKEKKNYTLVDNEAKKCTDSIHQSGCNSEKEDLDDDDDYYTHESRHIYKKEGKLYHPHEGALCNDKDFEITLNEGGEKQKQPKSKFQVSLCKKNNQLDVKLHTKIEDFNAFHDRCLELKFREPRIIVVAATNRPEDCDQALLRRFTVRVLVGIPSVRDRKRIIKRFLKGIDNSLTSSQLLLLSKKTEGFSGSDLESLTREAAMAPIRDCLRAAALLKAKARRTKKRKRRNNNYNFERHTCQIKCEDNNAASSYNCDVSEEDETDHNARELLLHDFQSLRPVSLSDFERAISFWIGNRNESTSRFSRDNYQLLDDENTGSDEE